MLEKLYASLFLNITLAALIYYLLTIRNYSYNMPYGDDYDAILHFLNKYTVADFSERILLFFSQHNEHRIFLTHFFQIFDVFLFGKINFTHLIWLGNIGWLLCILFLWLWAKKNSFNIVEFCPVIILLLSFTHHEMMTWAMTSVQQYYQVLFSLITISLMVYGRPLLTLIFYALAVFTSGGGMALVPLLNIYYLINKQWLKLLWAFLFTLCLMLCYFVLLPYSSPPVSKIIDALANPIEFSGYFFGFIGAAGNFYSIGFSSILITGILLFAAFLYRFSFLKNNYAFLFWIGIYVYLTAILTALNRSDIGIYSSGDSRYSEYSLLLISILYLSNLLIIKNTKPFEGKKLQKSIIFGFCMTGAFYLYWSQASLFFLNDRFYWLTNNIPTHPNKDNAALILKKSEELGIFLIPTNPKK